MQSTSLPSPNKAQDSLHKKLREMGCCVCLFHYRFEDTPASIHHLVEGNKRISQWHVLPLCETHHQNGKVVDDEIHVSRHSVVGDDGKAAFEAKYGTEEELMILCGDWINEPMYFLNHESKPNAEDYEEAEESGSENRSTDNDHDTGTDANDQRIDSPSQSKSVQVRQSHEVVTRVDIYVLHYRWNSADPDGLNAKAAIDACVAGGVLQDDSRKYVRKVEHVEKIISKQEKERTKITFTPVSELAA